MTASVGELKWDETGERYYQNGVRKGVLYPYNSTNKTYNTGVAWNGLTSVQVTPSGGEANNRYADDMKYLALYSVEDNGATIEAFTYPDAFEACDGSKVVTGTTGLMARAQTRDTFGLSWRTNVGNDQKDEVGYIIHILYGCKASPSERQYQTINESPEPITFSWEITTTPPAINVEGFRNTALFEVDSRTFVTTTEKALLTGLEETLYGKSTWEGSTETKVSDPTLPLPAALITLMTAQG